MGPSSASSCNVLSRSLTYLNAVISGSVHEFSEIMLDAWSCMLQSTAVSKVGQWILLQCKAGGCPIEIDPPSLWSIPALFVYHEDTKVAIEQCDTTIPLRLSSMDKLPDRRYCLR
jgi:hypothetical protein